VGDAITPPNSHGYCHGQTGLFPRPERPEPLQPGLEHLNDAVRDALNTIASTPELAAICAAIPDRPKHANRPRAVTARAYLSIHIALHTLDQRPTIDTICELLSTTAHQHLTRRNRLDLGAQPNTRIKRSMIHHTSALIRREADVDLISDITALRPGTC
jgi:hypothetical protein